MTDQEKKLHRGLLLADLEEAESELAYARDRAIAIAGELESVASTLRRNADLEPSGNDFTADGDIENRLTPDQRARYQDVQAVAGSIEEMKKMRQSVYNLRKRKNHLSMAV